jgi:hypothetical protein
MFSRKIREMGLKMYIYPNVDIVHWGYKNFPGNYDKFLRKQAKETGTPEITETVDKAQIIDTRTHPIKQQVA